MVRKQVSYSNQPDWGKGKGVVPHECQHCKELHQKAMESSTDALSRMFKEMGAKVVTIKLTKKQQREWDKRDKEIEKFLADKYTSQENAKKCKMVFKSGTRTDRTPVKAKPVEVVKFANPGKVNGSINLKQKPVPPENRQIKEGEKMCNCGNSKSYCRCLPKNWGKVRVGKCSVQF